MQATATNQRLQELLPGLFEPPKQTGDRYLRFQLTADRVALLPLYSVRGVMQLSADEVTLIPGLPNYALGLTGAFNQVFCAIDLAQLLGIGLLAGSLRQYALVAVRAVATEVSRQAGVAEGEPVLGLAVPGVRGVKNLLREDIAAVPADLPTELLPFVAGTAGGELILSIDALIAAAA